MGARKQARSAVLTREAPPPLGERRGTPPDSRGSRFVSFSASSYNADAHTVEAVFSSGVAVERWFGVEQMEISPEAVDLSRIAANLCPFLNAHNAYDIEAVLGRVTSASIENGQLVGTITFNQTEQGIAAEAMVARGELTGISIGYLVRTWTLTETTDTADTWTATSWELLEVSLVPVPADPTAGIRSAPVTADPGTTAANGENQEEDEMLRRNLGGAPAAALAIAAAADAAAEPAARAAEPAPALVVAAVPTVTATRISQMCARTADLGSDFALTLIQRNEATPMTEADLLGAVNERLLEARPAPAAINARAGASGTEEAGYRQAVEDAVVLRTSPGAALAPVDGFTVEQRIEAAREFRGMTLMELARDFLGRTGIDARGLNRLEIAGAAIGMRYGAISTSDFANALSNAANKRVRAAYVAAPQTFGQVTTPDTLPDFKPANIVAIGDAPALLNVPEGAEFKRGKLSDSGVTYQLATYGRVIAITRQAIVNDDKRLFNQIPTMFGRKAADLESDLVWGTILANAAMGDGIALFHASHGNLGSAAAITVASVGAAEQAMLSQTNPDGGNIIIRPEYLIVGAAKKVEAEQFLTAVTANQTSNVNPYPGNLSLIVEPRITGNQWYLAAAPSAAEGLVLAHLDGQETLFIETRVGFDVDGIETKARLDVGAAMVYYRGWYKNPGN